MSISMREGTVREYDAQRGYGLIDDDQALEYFVHFRELKGTDTLQAGQRVRFQAVLHRKGNIANQVEPI